MWKTTGTSVIWWLSSYSSLESPAGLWFQGPFKKCWFLKNMRPQHTVGWRGCTILVGNGVKRQSTGQGCKLSTIKKRPTL